MNTNDEMQNQIFVLQKSYENTNIFQWGLYLIRKKKKKYATTNRYNVI